MEKKQASGFMKPDTLDVVIDGTLYVGVPAASVMITSESDLEKLPAYPAGTIAFTAGYQNMWQLAADGTWETILEVSDSD